MQNPTDSDTGNALQPTDGITMKTETINAIAYAIQRKVTFDQINKQKNVENHITSVFDHKMNSAEDKVIKYADKKEKRPRTLMQILKFSVVNRNLMRI